MTARSMAAGAPVFCVRLDNMGDVLMTTPALRALKHAVAGRSLDLLPSPAASSGCIFAIAWMLLPTLHPGSKPGAGVTPISR